MVSNLIAMASNLTVMASNPIAMASNLIGPPTRFQLVCEAMDILNSMREARSEG